MGPMLMFDKSALQSFSLDESVWLDNFFLTNITPLFYVESLADLEKEVMLGKTPEQVVGELARKTPEKGSYPNIFHNTLILGDLLGKPIEMRGRVIIKGEQPSISPDGKVVFIHKEFPEQVAMQRWQKGEFLEVERETAKQWRQALSNLSFESLMAMTKNIVPMDVHFSNLEQIKDFVDKFVTGNDKSILDLAFIILDVPEKAHPEILGRWEKERHPVFNTFAPYAAYVLTVDLFFYLALISSFISKDRPSNKIDLSYLYYLPFCRIFVSSDKLHERTVPLFIGKGQTFVKGHDFKAGLKELDDYFSKFQEEISEQGLMRFAPYPPKDVDTFIGRLWDNFGTTWRKDATERDMGTDGLPSDEKLVKHLDNIEKNSIPFDDYGKISSDEADSVMFTRTAHVQKGKWRIMPKGIENKEKKE